MRSSLRRPSPYGARPPRVMRPLVLSLHHPDDPQQDHRTEDGGEQREPPTARRGIEEETQQEPTDERADDADHDVHQNARATALDDLAGEPPGDRSDDDV